jgi:uncharacterized membrane protein YgcG
MQIGAFVGVIVVACLVGRLFPPVTIVTALSIVVVIGFVIGCVLMYALKRDNEVKDAIRKRLKVKPKSAADYYKWKHLMPLRFRAVRSLWKCVLWAGLIAIPTIITQSFFRVSDMQAEQELEQNAAYQQLLATTQAWTASTIELPHLKDGARYVSNPDSVVTSVTEDSLNRLMRRFDDELGIESAVVVVQRVEDKDIYKFAQSLFDQYGIGKNDRGLVMVLAYADHLVRTHTGYALEDELTDTDCSTLQHDYLLPYMRSEQPDEGMLCWANAIFALLKNNEAGDEVVDSPVVTPLMRPNALADMEDSLCTYLLISPLLILLLIGAWVYTDDYFWWLSDRTSNSSGRRRGGSGGSSHSGLFSGGGSSYGGYSGGGYSGGYSGGGSGGGGATSSW